MPAVPATKPRRSRARLPASAVVVPSPEPARELLKRGLQQAADLLRGRRADLIDEGLIAECVALNWLEWHGGNLRLTVVGSNVCKQLASA